MEDQNELYINMPQRKFTFIKWEGILIVVNTGIVLQT